MIVYVESNFVVEIALEQEDAAAALDILSEAERHNVTLAIPEFSITEPISTVTTRGRNRQRLSATLNDQVRELSRSIPHQASVDHSATFLYCSVKWKPWRLIFWNRRSNGCFR